MQQIVAAISQENPEPKVNTFFAALAASQERTRRETPTQAFYSCFRDLKRASELGDVCEWQLALETFESLKNSLEFDGFKELEIQVNLRKLEMTFLLKAGKKAAADAEQCDTEAGRSEAPEQARDLRLKAHRLRRLAEQFHAQLLSLMEA